MSKPLPLKTVADATAALERYAALSGQVAAIARRRDAILSRANAAADRLAMPLTAELATIAARLEPWWAKNAAALTDGKRKSIELGGCMIGSKSGRATLSLAGDDFDAAAAKLRLERWAKPFVVVKVSIDRTATLKALGGPHGDKLKAAGFAEKPGSETFFVNAVAQAGAVSTN